MAYGGAAAGGGTSQVNADWNATSGLAYIYNKPPITWVAGPPNVTTVTDNLTVTGTHQASILLANDGGTTYVPTPQGAFVSWNRTGGSGETDFINNHGGGIGGWNFYDVPVSGSPVTQVFSISGAGNITLPYPVGTQPQIMFGSGSSLLNSIDSLTNGNLHITAGCWTSSGGVWNATATSATILNTAPVSNAALFIYANTGLTAGTTFGPARVFAIDMTGSIIQCNAITCNGVTIVSSHSLVLSDGTNNTTISETGGNLNFNPSAGYLNVTVTGNLWYFAGASCYMTNGGAFRVYSADNTRYFSVTVANAQSPVLNCPQTSVLSTCSLSVTATSGTTSVICYSPDGTRNIAIGMANGAVDPTINSNTGNIVSTSSLWVYGYRGRQGTSGGVQGNYFNWWWTSPNIQAWVDTTLVGNLTYSSDYRIKEDIRRFETAALPLMNQLRVVHFKYKNVPDDVWQSDGIEHIGFLAHEVGDVLPSACWGEKDALTSDGKIQPQAISQLDLIALLTKAVQELAYKVSILEERRGFSH
jgi:hypothetical protein